MNGEHMSASLPISSDPLSNIACMAALEIDDRIQGKPIEERAPHEVRLLSSILGDSDRLNRCEERQIGPNRLTFKIYMAPHATIVHRAIADVDLDVKESLTRSIQMILDDMNRFEQIDDMDVLMRLRDFCLALSKRACERENSMDDLLSRRFQWDRLYGC